MEYTKKLEILCKMRYNISKFGKEMGGTIKPPSPDKGGKVLYGKDKNR